MDSEARRRTLVGARIGNHELVEVLGAGGMGVVYRARHAVLDRTVAVKILDAEQAIGDVVERCFREARAVSDVSHPNVVHLHDCGVVDLGGDRGVVHYLVFELLAGRSLRAVLADGPLGFERARGIAVQIARGLAAAHAAGIVHRDVKPENVFVGDGDAVKVLDFGLAKITDPAAAGPLLSRSGVVLGTPLYMAPEQLDGQPVDGRADVYALGMVLHELLTGHLPFNDEPVARRMWRRMNELPGAPSLLAPGIPGRLDDLVLAALEPTPACRIELADLLAALEDPAGIAGPSRRELPTRPVGRVRPAPAQAPGPAPGVEHAPAPAAPRRPRLLLAILGVGAIAGAVALAIRFGAGDDATLPAVAVVPDAAIRLAPTPPTPPTPLPDAARAAVAPPDAAPPARPTLRRRPRPPVVTQPVPTPSGDGLLRPER